MTMQVSDGARLSRQEQLIPGALQEALVVVAGVGMLGGYVAMALSKMCAHVYIADPDDVEDVNTGNQPYNMAFVGAPKVEALKEMLAGLPVTAYHGEFPLDKAPRELFADAILTPTEDERKLIVVSAADVWEVRGAMANWARVHGASTFIDTRAMENTSVVITCTPDRIEQYLKEELTAEMQAAAPEAPCGMKGTSYVGMATAARVCSTLCAQYRGAPFSYFHVEDVVMDEVLRKERA